jgi:hypothetical protein
MKSFLSILVLLLVLVLEVRAQTWAEGDIQVSRKLSTAGFAPAELAFGSGLNVAYNGTSKTITVTTSGGAGLGTVTSFAFTNSTGITGTVTNATTTPTLALSLTSAAVGLGNVENTALSTWAGSSALTTLGTITTGTWQGTAIGDTYISSAATWNAKQAPGNYLTALTGDVTASGPGSAAATIANAAVTATKLASNAARDNLTGGTGTLNLSAFTLTLPSDVTRLGSSIDLSGAEVTGSLPWASVSKTGSSLADLATRSATDLTSGTLPDARFPATLPAASGTNLTSLDPYNLQQRSATNGQALVWNTTNSRWQPGTVGGGSGTPGGNDTELQYNNAGAFGGVDILWVSQSLMMPTNSTGTRAQLGMYSGSITSDIPAKAGDLLTYGGDEAATAQDSDADGGAGGDIRTYGGNGFATGSSGGDRPGGSGGTIDTSGGNASAGVAGRAGGSITTSNGGGSIDTTGSGSLQLGVIGTRTTILGAASSNWTLTLPTGPGTNGQVMTTNGSGTTSWTTPSGSGTVTSVGGTGTVNGLTLTGTVTTSGNLTLGGTLSGVSLTSAVTGTLPVANGGTGITALGTGVATALGVNVGSAGAFVTHGGDLGTPSSGTATNLTGTASGLTAGEATAALGLKTATTTVSVSGATAPTSGQVLTATSGTAATWQTPSGGGGTPGGSDTQVQFNDGGSFGGDAGLTYNKTTDTLTAGTFSGSGASLTTLNASNLSSGTVATARLGSGTADSTTFLRGDNTWATPSGGGGPDVTVIVNKNGTDQTAGNGGYETVTWSNEVSDPDGDFASNALTVASGEIWLFTGAITAPGLNTGQTQNIALYKDGTLYRLLNVTGQWASTAVTMAFCTILTESGDYTVRVTTSNTVSRLISGATSQTYLVLRRFK